MRDKEIKEGWQGFLALCSKLSSAKELDLLFDIFFTFDERENLSSRYLLIRELLEGKKTQREIAEELHISIAKITRGSNRLKTVNAKWKKLLLEFYQELE